MAFGTIDSWLIWKLTDGKVHVTDETNASRIMLFDIHARRWDHELLKILNVPHSMLPEVNSSSDVYGQTAGSIAGDQQSALFGQMCHKPGVGQEHVRHGLLHADEHGHGTTAPTINTLPSRA